VDSILNEFDYLVIAATVGIFFVIGLFFILSRGGSKEFIDKDN
jgi:hypothetical protein